MPQLKLGLLLHQLGQLRLGDLHQLSLRREVLLQRDLCLLLLLQLLLQLLGKVLVLGIQGGSEATDGGSPRPAAEGP